MTILIDDLECWDDVGPYLCPSCGKESTLYSSKWDSSICKGCNVWINGGCSTDVNDHHAHEKCYFSCWNRPKTPFKENQ